MSKPKTISIDGTDYIRADSQPTVTGDIQIVVADRSWNFIGRTTHNGDGSITIKNAQVIRRWGTSKGLGQLALEGKQSNTVLDDSGTVTIPAHAVVAVFDTDASKWQ